MKKIMLSILSALFAMAVFAQKNTYIGLEIPIEIKEINSYLNEAHVKIYEGRSPKFSLNLRQDLSELVAVETGLMYTPYNVSRYTFPVVPESNLVDMYSNLLVINTDPNNTTAEQFYLKSPNLSKWEIPLRFITKIHLYKKVFLTSQLGCIVNINTQNINKNEIITAYKIVDPNKGRIDITEEYRIQNLDTTKYEINHTGKKPDGLNLSLEAGLGLEYHTNNGAFFKAFVTFAKGFNTLSYDYFRLTPENGSPQTTAFKSMGNYYSFGISYFYPISNLWRKKPETTN